MINLKFVGLVRLLCAVAAMANLCHAADLVVFEAESGSRGSDWALISTNSPTYITITTDDSLYNPSNAARVATYTITFPSAGTYQLYARVRVGPGGFNDDSMFYANGFGTKSPTSNSDWIFVNGLAAAGFSNRTDVVTGGGVLGSGMWKWINLSQFTVNAGFVVSAPGSQTFQIGARETGLDLDKFAFGTAGTAFTVSNLDTGTLPPVTVLTNAFTGPDGMALHRFNPLAGSLNLDGANPAGGLVLNGGAVFGTALNGGVGGAGTAFSVSLDGSAFTAFHSFTNSPDAGNPRGKLLPAGNSYLGSTTAGGSAGVGTVFLVGTNGNVAVIRSFSAMSADEATNFGGATPNTLLASAGGTVFGTASVGGAAGNGTIFSISTNGPVFAVLHDFSPLDLNSGTNSDGATPAGGLVLAGDTLYGTASAGGAGGAGIVFSIRTNGGNFTVLHPFSSLDAATATNVDGACPVGGLVLSNGLLYGTTLAGGRGGSGVIFAVGTNGLGFYVLHSFSAVDLATGTNGDGASPCGTLALANGRLYGAASAGGANASGAIFFIDTNGAEFQLIYAFSALATAAGTNRDGAFPVASVLPVGNSLYGAAFAGGPGGEGTLFSLSLPPASARITDVRRNIDGTIRLSFAGGVDSTNVVQAATNLTSASWQNLSTNTADTNGLWEFVDTTATQYPGRYYRSLSF